VLNLLDRIIHAPTTKTSSKRYILTALVKLITRLSPTSIPYVLVYLVNTFTALNPHFLYSRIRKMLEEFNVHLNAELQQRAVEYAKISDLERVRLRNTDVGGYA